MNGTSVAIVVLNYCDNSNTLRIVRDYTSFKAVMRIAVVDNSGSEGLCGDEVELKNPKVTFLRIENQGYGNGNNRGIDAIIERFGLPDIIVISNPDVIINEGDFNQCLEFLLGNKDFALAAPRMARPDGSLHPLSGWKERTFLCDLAYSSGILSRLIGMRREEYRQDYWNAHFSQVDCAAGSFFMIRGEALVQAGCFDENTFLFYEEDILGYKLKRMGCREAVLNTCRFIHNEGVSTGKSVNLCKKYRIMQKSRLYFHRKYKRVGAIKYGVLCLATSLGMIECMVKTAVRYIKQSKCTNGG